jgi:xanthine dehydrogenase YagS FAD-binding subunit
MIDFEYVKPKTFKEAGDILSKESGSAMPYGGGTDLLGLIKDQVLKPQKLVDLKSINNMDSITYKRGEGLWLGSLVKIVDLAENKTIKNYFPILSEAANEIASPQLRNIGTLGGNLCQRPRCFYFREDFDCIKKGGNTCYAYEGNNKYHCIVGGGPCYIVHPSDMAVALLALDAKVVIYRKGEMKDIPISEFYKLPEEDYMNENILKPGEFITEVVVPEMVAKSSYTKIKERGAWDFAIVSVGAVIESDGDKIRNGRIAFGGVAPKPWMDENLNKILTGLELTDSSIETASANTLLDVEPLGMNNYKIILARNLVKKLLTDLRTKE